MKSQLLYLTDFQHHLLMVGYQVWQAIQNQPHPCSHFSNIEGKDDIYSFVQHKYNAEQYCTFGDPINVNPNSSSTVKTALIKILDDADIAKPGCEHRARKWGLVYCDGQPYNLAAKLQDTLYECPICKKHIFANNLDTHIKQCGIITPDINISKVFENIILMPGLGHVELNMLRCYFKLTWDIVMEHVGSTMNFKSPKAKQSLYCVYDHHKSWQAFLTFLIGTSDHIIQHYIDTCTVNKYTPNSNHFFQWCNSIKNKAFAVLLELLFSYGFGIFLFRAGVRRNNSEIMICARQKFYFISPMHQTTVPLS